MIADRVRPQLQKSFSQARNICVLTGMEFAADSGVPRFYGKVEPWQGHPISELLTLRFFHEHPTTLWEWLEHRRVLVAGLEPGSAYRLLADWELRFQSLTLITQTVDGLHARAGNRHILELQGSIWRGRCSECHRLQDLPTIRLLDLPPRCALCDSRLRPGINFVNESPPLEMMKYLQLAMTSCDLFLLIGVRATFIPAASLLLNAKTRGVPVVEVTESETDLTPMCDETLIGPLNGILAQF